MTPCHFRTTGMIRQLFMVSGIVLCIAPSFSLGQQRSLLSLSVRNAAPSNRTSAPVALECKLEYSAQRLLEGHLKLELFDSQQRCGVVQHDDIVLSGGDYEFNLMLPPFKAPISKAIDIYPTFVTADDTIKMEPLTLIVSAAEQRGTLGMFVIDTSFRSPAQKALEKVLNPNRYNFYSDWNEQDRANISGTTRLDFYPARYDYTDVPISPLRYCVADLVVICDATLGKLREKQLSAMESWIHAGGCACIVPDGQLSVEHLSFLNRLADVTAREKSSPFLSDGEGSLNDREYGEHGYELHHSGLGRVAIVSPKVDLADLTDVQIGPLNAFMWRIRAEHSNVAAGEPWVLAKTPVNLPRNRGGRVVASDPNQAFYSGYNQSPLPAIHGLMRRTMPKDVKIIPFGIVGSLLVLYVLAIGPGDYFLLGLFKLRKLTWIVFPIVTLAFTLFTVWLSHYYMGSGDEGKPVIFVDVVTGNQVARTSEFSLIFSGSQKQVVDEVDNAIATGIDQHGFGGYDPAFSGRPYQSDSSTYSAPVYAGRFPTQYRMIQQVEQWSPRLNRKFRISPRTKLPGFDWDNPGIDGRLVANNRRTDLKDRLKNNVVKTFGANASVVVFHRDQTLHIHRGSLGRLFNDEQIVHQAYGYEERQPRQRKPINVLYEACVRSPIQLFEVMYQISPTGADNFEDLTLLDSSDPNQWLLVVITEEVDGYKVYRRLYNEASVVERPNQNAAGPANGQSPEPQ